MQLAREARQCPRTTRRFSGSSTSKVEDASSSQTELTGILRCYRQKQILSIEVHERIYLFLCVDVVRFSQARIRTFARLDDVRGPVDLECVRCIIAVFECVIDKNDPRKQSYAFQCVDVVGP